MAAQSLGLETGSQGTGDLPDGFVIEERLDDRHVPAAIVFDVVSGGRRVAWGLRTRDAAVRWAVRLAGVAPRTIPHIRDRRRPVVSPWWTQAS